MNRKIDMILKRFFLFVCLLTICIFVSASSYSRATITLSSKDNQAYSSVSTHILLQTFKSHQASSFYTTFSSLFVTKQLIKSLLFTAISCNEFLFENKAHCKNIDFAIVLHSRKNDLLYPFHYHW